MRGLNTLSAAALVVAIVPAMAQAQVPVEVVHGIVPADVVPGAHSLPVDISVNGDCVIEELDFGQTLATELEPGSYEVLIFLDHGGSCDGTFVAGSSINIQNLSNNLVVAHLDENGTPDISAFTRTIGFAAEDGAVVLNAYHGAVAPPVDVKVKSEGRYATAASFLSNGGQSFPAEIGAGDATVRLTPAGKRSTVFEQDATFEDGFAYAAIAVGSLPNETLQLIVLAEELIEADDSGEDENDAGGETE
ncbi:MAG: hypothetical protein AAF637_16575 [Pseudomonadota bacterium]